MIRTCLWAVVSVSLVAPAATARQSGADPVPVSEFLLDEATEIALARSAAPPEISADATVKVLRPSGFEVAVEGTNEFVCLVVRSWGNPTFAAAGLYQPATKIPECCNRHAVATILPIQELRHEMGARGLDAATIERAVFDRIRSGEFALPEKGALPYMMSNAMETSSGSRIEPHVMWYVTGYTRDDTGGIGWGVGPSTFRTGRPYVEDGWGSFVAVSFPTAEGYDPVLPSTNGRE